MNTGIITKMKYEKMVCTEGSIQLYFSFLNGEDRDLFLSLFTRLVNKSIYYESDKIVVRSSTENHQKDNIVSEINNILYGEDIVELKVFKEAVVINIFDINIVVFEDYINIQY